MLVKVAEQWQAAVLQSGGAVVVLAVEAGDEIVDQLGDGSVLAHDYKARRHTDSGLRPQPVRLLVVTVQGFQRRLQLDGQAEGVQVFRLAPAFTRHAGADVLPQVTESGRLAAGNVVGDGHAWQLYDAALDGVHQGEVAHSPGEQGALRVAGAAQEEGRGGEIHHPRYAELAVHRFEARDPEPRSLVVLLCLVSVFAL